MKKILVLMAGILSIGVNLYAGDGDFIIEGNVGIGTQNPSSGKLEVVSTDSSAVKTTTTRSANTNISGHRIEFIDTTTGANTGFTGLYVNTEHQGSYTGGWQNLRSAAYVTRLKGSSVGAKVIGQQIGISLQVPSGKSYSYLTDMVANEGSVGDMAVNAGSIAVQKIALFNALTSFENGAGTLDVTDLTGLKVADFGYYYGGTTVTATNVSGIKIDKQSSSKTKYTVTNPMGIWLNGDGVGADLVLGAGQNAKIYWDGTNLVSDTNGGVGYFTSQVSATGYITRTSIWDKKKGKALDFVKDADSLTDASGIIMHENFPEKVTYQVTDYDNCWEVVRKVEYCWIENEERFCVDNIANVPPKTIIKKIEHKEKECGKKNETGVSMGLQVAKHEQALYEAYQTIKELQNELCLKDSSYKWCK